MTSACGTRCAYTLPKPERPVRSPEEFRALRAVADQLPPEFAVLLDLAWHTGHRISALLALRWQDVHLTKSADNPFGWVRWYAGKVRDNKKHEHEVALNEPAYHALVAWRKRDHRIPTGLLFPCPKNPTNPRDPTAPKDWLRRAEALAGVPHRRRGGWHQFRRGWATARKDKVASKDLMAAGGWSDEATMNKCYVHATKADTLKAALFVA